MDRRKPLINRPFITDWHFLKTMVFIRDVEVASSNLVTPIQCLWGFRKNGNPHFLSHFYHFSTILILLPNLSEMCSFWDTTNRQNIVLYLYQFWNRSYWLWWRIWCFRKVCISTGWKVLWPVWLGCGSWYRYLLFE